MATRRQKLRDVFARAVEEGVTVEDLYDRIESFTAAGGSGIENFLDQTLVELATPASKPVVATVKAHLSAAIEALDSM